GEGDNKEEADQEINDDVSGSHVNKDVQEEPEAVEPMDTGAIENNDEGEQEVNQPVGSQTAGGIDAGGNGAGDGNNNAETGSNKPSKPPKKKKSKAFKISISSLIALVIILGAGYFVGDALLSSQKTVEAFEDAVNDGDAKELASLLDSDESDLTIDESSVQGLIDYYSDNSDKLDDVVDHLNSQSEKEDESSDGYAINLQKDGKKFFIYDNYV